MSRSADLAATLDALFDGARAERDARAELADAEPDDALPLLERATRAALGLQDEDEAAVRLVSLARLLAEMEGPRVVDLLVDVLGSADFEARTEAGEALAALAWDRFKEVAQGAERAVERLPHDHPALLELPYLLVEIPEPGTSKVLARFVRHPSADVVAAAVEAIAEGGDAGSAALLDALAGDTRKVQLEDEGGTEGEATIAELAAEAKQMIAKRGAAT